MIVSPLILQLFIISSDRTEQSSNILEKIPIHSLSKKSSKHHENWTQLSRPVYKLHFGLCSWQDRSHCLRL